MYYDGVRKYQESNVSTMSPERMIVMLYEGIVRHLEDARAAIAAGDIAARARGLDKARDIISELNHSLDLEVGGDIARNLSALYGFLGHELLEARISGRVEHVDNALRVIQPVLESWRAVKPGAADRARAESSPAGVEDGPELAAPPQTPSVDEAERTRKDFCVAV